MSRRVPEFALLIGVVLGLTAVVFGLLFGLRLLDVVVLAAVGAYPFVAFGLLRDDDPASVVPPRWILVVGVLWAFLGVVGVLAADPSPSALVPAAFAGLVLALPPAAYAVRHGADVNPLPPRATLGVGVVAGVGLLALGLVTVQPVLGTVSAVLLSVAAGLYATARGVRLAERTRRAAVAAGALLGVAVVAVGVVRGADLTNWVLAGIAVAFEPSLYVVLSRNRSRGRRRRTR
ncbi:hypothetical protein [Halogeometricum luteum]|uniref:Uncharacterized protein n=1 Tax=Halogeometricum luteum TaxID=2950537 RepID=A0ABU2G6T7_9EURY|nr:hypothetical protein [Halogeometricum sp. S3BR5-2]MDS0296500.1 hypothetical protein [Halogeometricum sp. S3BR5-2]